MPRLERTALRVVVGPSLKRLRRSARPLLDDRHQALFEVAIGLPVGRGVIEAGEDIIHTEDDEVGRNADDATMLLVQDIAQGLREMRVLIVGTYRDVGLEGARPPSPALEQAVRQRT